MLFICVGFYDISRENLYNNHKSGRAWPLRKCCDLFVFVESFPLRVHVRVRVCVRSVFVCFLFAANWFDWRAQTGKSDDGNDFLGSLLFPLYCGCGYAPGIVFGVLGEHKSVTSYGFGFVFGDAQGAIIVATAAHFMSAWMPLRPPPPTYRIWGKAGKACSALGIKSGNCGN